MFFGTAASGDLWDCDCRPSDGIWMALRSQKPVYVHEKVATGVAKVNADYLGAVQRWAEGAVQRAARELQGPNDRLLLAGRHDRGH